MAAVVGTVDGSQHCQCRGLSWSFVVGSALWVHNIPDAVLMTLACSEHNMRGKSVLNLENEVTEGKNYQVGTGTLVQQLD